MRLISKPTHPKPRFSLLLVTTQTDRTSVDGQVICGRMTVVSWAICSLSTNVSKQYSTHYWVPALGVDRIGWHGATRRGSVPEGTAPMVARCKVCLLVVCLSSLWWSRWSCSSWSSWLPGGVQVCRLRFKVEGEPTISCRFLPGVRNMNYLNCVSPYKPLLKPYSSIERAEVLKP